MDMVYLAALANEEGSASPRKTSLEGEREAPIYRNRHIIRCERERQFRHGFKSEFAGNHGVKFETRSESRKNAEKILPAKKTADEGEHSPSGVD